MIKSETSWLDNKQPCDRCDTEESVGFLFPLPNGQEICECCAIDIGWIDTPQGVETVNPIEAPVETASDFDLEEIADLY